MLHLPVCVDFAKGRSAGTRRRRQVEPGIYDNAV
jgi:hypothetical protein